MLVHRDDTYWACNSALVMLVHRNDTYWACNCALVWLVHWDDTYRACNSALVWLMHWDDTYWACNCALVWFMHWDDTYWSCKPVNNELPLCQISCIGSVLPNLLYRLCACSSGAHWGGVCFFAILRNLHILAVFKMCVYYLLSCVL